MYTALVMSNDGTFILAEDCWVVMVTDEELEAIDQMADSEREEFAQTNGEPVTHSMFRGESNTP